MRCENISTGRLDYYVENSGAVFIDLRSRQEYEKMHIKDAVNIPVRSRKWSGSSRIITATGMQVFMTTVMTAAVQAESF